MEDAEIGKWLRIAFSIAGAGTGVLGIILTLITYLAVAPAVGAFGKSAVSELDSAYGALGDAEAAADSTAGAIEKIPAATEGAAAALDAYGNSTLAVADALSSLGGALDKVSLLIQISPATVQSLKGGAGLNASSASMKKAAAEVRGIGSKANETAVSAKRLKADIGQVKDGILDAKEKTAALLDAAGKALFMGAAVAILAFLALISSSIAAAL